MGRNRGGNRGCAWGTLEGGGNPLIPCLGMRFTFRGVWAGIMIGGLQS